MKKRVFFSLILCIGICLTFVSCGTKYSAYAFDYFDTFTTITGYAQSKKKFDQISKEIFQELSEYHQLFTIYHRYEGMENLCTINELKDGEHRSVTVDDRIMGMLFFAKEMYQKTNGTVNIAMGSVLSIWHDYRDAGLDAPWKAELPPICRENLIR